MSKQWLDTIPVGTGYIAVLCGSNRARFYLRATCPLFSKAWKSRATATPAVMPLFGHADLVLVVGSPNSSNSNRLRELAEKQGGLAYLIDSAADIRPEWLEGRARIGVTAASGPESLVRDVITHLSAAGASGVRELDGEPQNVTFALTKKLRLRVVARAVPWRRELRSQRCGSLTGQRRKFAWFAAYPPIPTSRQQWLACTANTP